MSTRENNRTKKINRYALGALAAWQSQQTLGPTISDQYIYDVAKPTNPTFIQLTGGVKHSRYITHEFSTTLIIRLNHYIIIN
ncbi:MAG: hypothetical protein ACRD8W_15185 [Nitrososphaeraceae archaeon]